MRHNRLDDLSKDELVYLIDQYIHHERNRKIAYRRFIDGILFENLSEEFDLSPNQVKSICYKAEQTLIKHI